jgi:hypothetical protein
VRRDRETPAFEVEGPEASGGERGSLTSENRGGPGLPGRCENRICQASCGRNEGCFGRCSGTPPSLRGCRPEVLSPALLRYGRLRPRFSTVKAPPRPFCGMEGSPPRFSTVWKAPLPASSHSGSYRTFPQKRSPTGIRGQRRLQRPDREISATGLAVHPRSKADEIPHITLRSAPEPTPSKPGRQRQ